ncbi:SMI1/KNR4 family protein [uncultured Paludibaculum sp.]|uniref:SMI1/KNR4 family protein n=1 Tax=uncultured Paludibaculum sp. TaxID=1765020 RepID=UPI002AABD191|nr:SMI1/KNR4 family protein [uncultured Paludibaculum sp.]
MTRHEIEIFLSEVNRWILQRADLDYVRSELPANVLETNWLGAPPATEADILEVESRLGLLLPPSYKDFVRVSNGFLCISPILGPLLPTTEVTWFRERNQEIIDSWLEDNQDDLISDEEYLTYGEEQWRSRTRFGYLQHAIAITGPGDPVILLNPKVTFCDGEWEVWSFGTLHAGAKRFQSLGAALLAHVLEIALWK